MKLKKLLSIFLAVIMVLGVCPVMNVFAAEERTVIDSGICGLQGDNLKWTLYDDGELVISGEGEMDWYFVHFDDGRFSVPEKLPTWNDYYNQIEVITVEEGVTSIGHNAFLGKNTVYRRINLPESLLFIEDDLLSEKELIATRSIQYFLAICCAGNGANIQTKVCDFTYDKKTQECTRTYKETLENGVSIHSDYGSVYSGGEEPEAFCRILTDYAGAKKPGIGEKIYYAQYYAGEYEDIKLVWAMSISSGDLERVSDENGLLVKAIVTNINKFDSNIKLELKDNNGNVLSSDKAVVYETKQTNPVVYYLTLPIKIILGVPLMLFYYGGMVIVAPIIGFFNSIFK